MKILAFVLCAVFILLSVPILIFAFKSTEKETFFISSLTVLFAAIFCLPFFILSKRKIIFDGNTQCVYRKNIFGRKKLLDFSAIHEIAQRNTGLQSGYFIAQKGDLYGKGIYIGTPSKSDTDFTSTVLPAINQLITQTKPEPPSTATINNYKNGQFDFYESRTNEYILKPANKIKYIIPLVIVGIVWGFMLHSFLNGSMKKDTYLAFIPSIPFILIFANMTKRITFDLVNNMFIVRYLGIVMEKEKMEDFINFKITRKTTNGMHSGTDVRLLFHAVNGKQKQSFPLHDFNKTQNIERLIDETKYIINTING